MSGRKPEIDQQDTLLADYRRLKEENAALRQLLIENGIALPAQPKTAPASSSETAKMKRSRYSEVRSEDEKMKARYVVGLTATPTRKDSPVRVRLLQRLSGL